MVGHILAVNEEKITENVLNMEKKGKRRRQKSR